jgi:hypothetical protein
MKVSLGYNKKKSSFSGEKYGQNPCAPLAQTPCLLFHFGLCVYIFPMSAFLSKCPAGKIFGEIAAKIKHKKQNFWRKMLQKSLF